MLISSLFNHPERVDAVAGMVYKEFWIDVKDGMSVDDLVAHLKTAAQPHLIPLSLIALVDGQLAGTVNLFENDDAKRTHLRPWLAAMGRDFTSGWVPSTTSMFATIIRS